MSTQDFSYALIGPSGSLSELHCYIADKIVHKIANTAFEQFYTEQRNFSLHLCEVLQKHIEFYKLGLGHNLLKEKTKKLFSLLHLLFEIFFNGLKKIFCIEIMFF